MYKICSKFALSHSASSLENNLSAYIEADNKFTIGVVHKYLFLQAKYEKSILKSKKNLSVKESLGSNSNVIFQAKWLNCNGRCLLVLGTKRGIQVFEPTGDILLYWYAFPQDEADIPSESFARGIASCQELLCIGTHEGTLLLFIVQSSNFKIDYADNYKCHSESITEVCGDDKKIIASSDESGTIFIHQKIDSSLKKNLEIPGTGWPCTSLALWKNFLVGGYGSGDLKIFNTVTAELLIEVAAHAKWITALDVALHSGLILSVSEDTFIRVWRLDDGTNPKISHVFCHHVDNSPLVGGRFLDAEGSIFGVSSYDQPEVICFKATV